MTQGTASSRREVREAQKASEIREAQRKAFVRSTLMATIAGRAWVHDLLALCHIGSNPWNPDAAATSFACGELNIGLQLWSDIQTVCPDLYILMMQEASHQDAARSTVAERTREPDPDGGDQATGDDDLSDPGTRAIAAVSDRERRVEDPIYGSAQA